MRILVLTNMYPPHHLGGNELSCYDFVERMRARGHTVTVLTTTMRLPGVADPPDERPRGVRRDLRFYWSDHQLSNPSMRDRVAIERSNQKALTEALAAAAPDVVSVWNMGAMSLGLLTTLVDRRIPIVYVVCDDWLIYAAKLDAWSRLFARLPRFAQAALKLAGTPTGPAELGDTGTFLFVSESVRRAATHASAPAARHGSVVYSGIQGRLFPRPAGDARQKPWRWRLLYAGRLDERKGIHVAIEALSRLPEEATLEVIGRGDDRYGSTLRELAARLGLAGRVRFDVEERDVLHKRYAAADVLVFPVVWPEPFGLVPIEAMACGTPVVATGTGGSAEFLRHGVNCLLSPPGDSAALADAVRRLASDPPLRLRLIEAGFATADELDVDRLTDSLEAWHAAAADRFAAGRPPDRPSPLEVLPGEPPPLANGPAR